MGAGRKRIEIDERIFKELCGILCTKEEIAGVFLIRDGEKVPYSEINV